MARTLRPGGRLFASFFLLDEAGRRAVTAGTSNPPFPHDVEHGLIADARIPESAVACDASWLAETMRASGLEITAIHPGVWKGGRDGLDYQDLLTAIRK
jgi:hypothetical protein